MSYIKQKGSIFQEIQIRELKIENLKIKANTDYIAMMTDVDIPEVNQDESEI